METLTRSNMAILMMGIHWTSQY